MSPQRSHPRSEQAIFAALSDLNGIWRGKRLPVTQSDKIVSDGLRMPLSVCVVDVWGEDIDGSELVLASGDADGVCVPTGRAPVTMDYLSPAGALMPVWMHREDGTPFGADPRQVLAAVQAELTALGMTAVVGIELEFYLYCAGGELAPPLPPGHAKGDKTISDEILSLNELERFEALIADIYHAAAAADIAADGATSEAGPGQFEVNFRHIADPLKAADDVMIFKQLVRGFARRHGLGASFMAKPYGTRSGSGLHVHFSIIDRDGGNLFDDGSDQGSSLLHHAVAGLLSSMQENTLIWAPHANSYRRLLPGAHAPAAVSWGYENRTSALRIPGGDTRARRIEHRVAGADANPYLLLSAILGGALNGIETNAHPPAPVTGNAYEQSLPQLAGDWGTAVSAFEDGVSAAFNSELRRAMVQTKRQEIMRFRREVSAFEYQSYLDVV
jgi:glutamine synthetase